MHRVALLAVVVIFPPRSSTMLFTSSLFFDSFPRTRIFMLLSGLSRGLEITQHVSNRHGAPQTSNKHKGTASSTVSTTSPASGRQGSKQVWPALNKQEGAPLHLGNATKLSTHQQTEGMEDREDGYVGTLFPCPSFFLKNQTQNKTNKKSVCFNTVLLDSALLPSSCLDSREIHCNMKAPASSKGNLFLRGWRKRIVSQATVFLHYSTLESWSYRQYKVVSSKLHNNSGANW